MTLFGKNKTFRELMNDYYAAPNPLEQYKILQEAAKIAKDDEKLEVVLKVNQIKRDHGL